MSSTTSDDITLKQSTVYVLHARLHFMQFIQKLDHDYKEEKPKHISKNVFKTIGYLQTIKTQSNQFRRPKFIYDSNNLKTILSS